MPKHHGLRLTLGGAPHTPHVVPGVPGVYRPERATPVGGPGELPFGEAKRISDDPGIPLELVEIPSGALDALRDEVAADLQAAARGLTDALRGGLLAPAEAERATAEKAALTATEEG